MPSKKRNSAMPDWVMETPSASRFMLASADGPEPTDYELAMFNNGREDQYVKLSRKEFVALKIELARMRGHTAKGV
jgi:hypothetical protein